MGTCKTRTQVSLEKKKKSMSTRAICEIRNTISQRVQSCQLKQTNKTNNARKSLLFFFTDDTVLKYKENRNCG